MIELQFMREELTHVVLTIEITTEDAAHIKTLTGTELYYWIHEKSEAVSYAPGKEDTHKYEWCSGKEYTDGEGERGMWDFTIRERGKVSIEVGLVPEPVQEPTIADRVERATRALSEYDTVRDLLADLKHYCDKRDVDFMVEEMRGHDHYITEGFEAQEGVQSC